MCTSFLVKLCSADVAFLLLCYAFLQKNFWQMNCKKKADAAKVKKEPFLS